MSASPEADAARAAHLRYVSDRMPGISRERRDDGWVFRDADGSEITDEAAITRIKKLAIPPAYTGVWICRLPHGHIQATGRDARGRKQYRYHARWRTMRDDAKYAKMLVFGDALPRIRAAVAKDLAHHGLPREKVLAAAVRVLETTCMRVGNEEYATQNKSFGLTTLRNRHVRVRGQKLTFDFRGKHGVEHHIELADTQLAKLIARLRDLPGQDLFQYLDTDGARVTLTSDDVNEYLRAISGEDITAKDFRTWAATNLAALALAEFEAFDSQAAAKKNVLRAVESVAKRLGNTPAMCRKCYIHPAVFEGYLDGSLLQGLAARADATLAAGPAAGLNAEEAAVCAFLARALDGKRRAA